MPLTFEQMPNAVETLLSDVAQIKKSLNAALAKIEKESDEPLDINEAGEYLHLASKTVGALAAQGEIPYCKPAKKLLFFKSDLKEWVKASRRKTNEEIDEEVNQ